jgi:hypothetical protein
MRIVKHIIMAAGAAAVVIGAESAAPSAQQAVTPKPAMAPPSLKIARSERTDSLVQGYSVVLVLGDMQAGSTPDNVPPAAKKALADMKDFLPYKSYRLLDSQWTLGSSNVSTRLRGADDQDYSLMMSARLLDDGARALSVTFQLREGGTDVTERRIVEMLSAEARARSQYSQNHPEVRGGVSGGVSGGVTGGVAGGVNGGVAEGGQRGAGSGSGSGRGFGVTTIPRNASLISTSFTMDIGETVVVGTSRLKGGDKALIALLTAVPRNKTGPAGRD